MKKIITTLLLIFISISITNAQNNGGDSIKTKGLYFGIDGGYGFSAAKSTYQSSTFTYSSNVYTYSTTVKTYSLGKGINSGLYIGYMFTKQFGCEIGASYFIGQKFNRRGENSDSYQESSSQGSMMRIIPALKYVLGEKKFRTYMKVGLIVGLGTKVIQNDSYTTPMGSFVYDDTWEYKGGISFGFHGALGVNYMITNTIGVFAELAGNYQNWAPKKSELTKFNSNGVDMLSTLTTISKEQEYVSSYSYSSNNIPDPSQPQKSAKFYMPFSSVGFNIGLHIILDKKKK